MNESKTRLSHDGQPLSPNRRRCSEEFKRDAVRLVVEEQYTFKAAAKAVGVSEKSRRVKGSEKFWLEGGAEAILQLRAAQLSQDDRWARYWSRPRKHRLAVGSGRLAQGA